MENLSSAAAQGEQAFEPHHANGYNFIGADPNVRTLAPLLSAGPVIHSRNFLHIHPRPTVAWDPPPGAYRAREGSRTILFRSERNR